MQYSEVEQEYKKLNTEYTTFTRQSNAISKGRLFLFFIFLVFMVIGITDHNFNFFLFGVTAFLFFCILIVRHAWIEKEIQHKKAGLSVLKKYLDRYLEEWRDFSDDGTEFLKKNDWVSKDLDILGPYSLYQFLCVANTYSGRKELAQTLCKPNKDISILKRNEAIKELLEKQAFSLELETHSQKIGWNRTAEDEKYETFLNYCENQKTSFPKILMLLCVAFPIVFLGMLLLAWLGKLHVAYLGIYFVIAIAISWLLSGMTGKILSGISSFANSMEIYIDMFHMISEEKFTSSYLIELQEKLTGANGIHKGLSRLKFIGESYNLRYNLFIYQGLCGTLLWDLQLAMALEKWKHIYGMKIKEWFNVIAQMEMLLSLAVLGRVRECSFANITDDDKVHMEAVKMSHPLIPKDKVVPNSIREKAKTIVITGSNMSGKTTFLRTIGMNLVLAYIGAPVCAKNLICSKMHIFTSMRVTDDVGGGISTFYAEILRIKSMVEYSANGEAIVCLIDEIFKGTNSADRIVGAKAVIEKLSRKNTLIYVSTHDFELCEMSENNVAKAANYHFEEYYKKNMLEFDYQLRNGRCKTTNALQLMKMAGL